MIACDRPLVYRGLTNRLTGASLGCYLIRRRCSRQRKLANPLIRKGRLDVKRIFAYSATIISWIRSFCHGFFPFWQRLYFAICRKNLLVQLSVIFVHILLCPYWIRPWHLLRGEKQTNKQTNWSAGSLFPIPFFLPASAGGSTAKTTRISHKWACPQTGLSFIWG